MSTGAAAVAPTPKDEPARRSEIFQNSLTRLKVQIPPRQICVPRKKKTSINLLYIQTFTGKQNNNNS
jgi:hypothetical protein